MVHDAGAEFPKTSSLCDDDNKRAFWVAVASLITSVIAFFVGIVLYTTTHSAATLGFSLENSVDAISSALVVWRFWPAPEAVLESREKRASIGIAMSFIILGIVVGGVAIKNLVKQHQPSRPDVLINLAIPSIVILSALGVAKLHLGYKIDSPSLRKDGICSSIGALLAVGILVGNLGYKKNTGFWWFDAAVAVTLATVLFLYGNWTLVNNARKGNTWWTLSFWSSAANNGGISGVPLNERLIVDDEFDSEKYTIDLPGSASAPRNAAAAAAVVVVVPAPTNETKVPIATSTPTQSEAESDPESETETNIDDVIVEGNL